MVHTPGPWKVVNAGQHWNNKTTTNYQIQYGDDGECISDHVYEPADAQLIAAAPDLLEALKLLQNCMIARSAVEGDLPWTTDVVAAMKTASTAISKALAE